MALTANTNYRTRARDKVVTGDYPTASSVTVYKGAMVFADASGYATPTPTTRFLGFATEKTDNAGASASTSVRTKFEYGHEIEVPGMTGFSVTAGNVGSVLYATDDDTLTPTVSAVGPVGVLRELDGTNGWIAVGVAKVV